MAASHTKINRTIEALTTFLKYHQNEFFESWKELKPSKGWAFGKHRDEILQRFNTLYGTLYDRLAPLLAVENPATDKQIYDVVESLKDYVDKSMEWFSKASSKDPEFYGMATSEIYSYFELAYYALGDAVSFAEEDLNIKKVQNKKSQPSTSKGTKLKGEEKSKSSNIAICIVTTTDKEAAAVKALLLNVKQLPKDIFDSNLYFEGTYKDKVKIILTKSQFQGQTFAAVTTTKMISKFKPKYIAMVGYAAGNRNRKSEISIGDVLVCLTAVEYNQVEIRQRKAGEEKAVDRIEKKIPYHTDPYLFGLLNNFSFDEKALFEIKDEYEFKSNFKLDLKAQSGKFITGSSLIRSDNEIDEILRQNSGTVALDMETYGFYVACEHSFIESKPKYVSIKSVSDYGGHTDNFKNDETKYLKEVEKSENRQGYAAYTSAKFFLEFAIKHLME